MSFGERLKQIREEKGLQQDEVAKHIGLKAGNAISNYEKNTSKPHLYNFIKLCKLFNKDANYFLEEELSGIVFEKLPHDIQLLKNKYDNLSSMEREIVDYILNIKDNQTKQVEEIEPIKIYRFPVYEQKAAAGVGQLGRDSNYYMDEFTIDNIPNNAVFAMKISGESMNNEKTNNLIHTDSVVLINPRYIESELDDKIVIANFKGKIICKRYINEGNYALFQSDNPNFEEENRKSSDDPNCKVIGIVLGVIKDNRFIEVNWYRKYSYTYRGLLPYLYEYPLSSPQ